MHKITVSYKGKEVKLELTDEQKASVDAQIEGKKFIPKLHETYYFVVDTGCKGRYEIDVAVHTNSTFDWTSMKCRPVFPTKWHANVYRNYLEALDKHTFQPDWENHEEKKYFIVYDFKYNRIDIDDYMTDTLIGSSKTPYFKSVEDAEQFIKEVGEDNIKKFMFDIWNPDSKDRSPTDESLDVDMILINKNSRQKLNREDVYIFPFMICDNEVDRDNEYFSVDALHQMAQMYNGTVNASQQAKIFFTEVRSDDNKKFTSYGEPYHKLFAKAYVLVNDENKELISEIESGIKKEVSIGCSINDVTCSICGLHPPECGHVKGCTYTSINKKCYHEINEVAKVYEWEFVERPVKRN